MRTTLAFLLAMLVFTFVPDAVGAGPRDDTIALENANYRVEVARAHGLELTITAS